MDPGKIWKHLLHPFMILLPILSLSSDFTTTVGVLASSTEEELGLGHIETTPTAVLLRELLCVQKSDGSQLGFHAERSQR